MVLERPLCVVIVLSSTCAASDTLYVQLLDSLLRAVRTLACERILSTTITHEAHCVHGAV
jgi:hypothetical protein